MSPPQPDGAAEPYEPDEIPTVLRGVMEYHVGIRAIDPRTGQVTSDPLLQKDPRLAARSSKIYYTPEKSLTALPRGCPGREEIGG